MNVCEQSGGFGMRTIKPPILCAILLASCLPLTNVTADSEEVCCDSTTVELFLLGPASSGEMSPSKPTSLKNLRKRKFQMLSLSKKRLLVGKSIHHGLVLILHLHGNSQLIMKLLMQVVHKLTPLLKSPLVAILSREQQTKQIHS